MILSLSLLVLLIPGLLGSRPGECKRDKDREFKQVCTVDEDCKDPDKKCCPTTSDGMVCRQPAQTCRQLDCGPSATCSHSSSSSLPFCDDCNPNQCQNGGTCTDGDHSHSCACPGGFTGTNCQTNIDDCSPNPCQNGGTCTDGVNSYTCTCPPGFTGNTCNDNIDDCSPNPCLNGGTCTDGVNSSTCTCPPCFTGNTCNVILNISLVGGSNPSEGRVQIYYNGVCGTVCDDYWDVNEAVVVCRQLGFSSGGTACKQACFGQGTDPILLDDVACVGTESSILDCPHLQPVGSHNCVHSEDAGVDCV